MKQAFLPLLLTFLFSCLKAQDTLPTLSLPKCIEIGLEKNYALRIVRNQEEIADNNKTIGNAGFLPVIDLNAGYTGALANTKSKNVENVEITSNGVHNDGVNAGIALGWTIFDGLQMQAKYERLKELQQMGKLQTRLTIEQLVVEIAVEYYNHIYQNLRLENLKKAVELSQERVRIVEARYEIGAASSLDVNQAKVDLNTDVSRVVAQEEIVNYSVVNLNKLLSNENVDEPFLIADSVIALESLLELNLLREKTLDSNTDILLASKNKRLSELDEKAIRSRYFPYLKLNAGYGYGFNRFETGSIKQNQSMELNYGVTLGMNLFEGFNTKRELNNARIEIENKKLQQDNIKLELLATLTNLYLAYQNNWKLLTLERQNLVVAKKYYDAAVDRYMVGSLSGIELREAQQSVLDAENNWLLATYNIKVCEISLKQISGDIVTLLNL
jgi:outer membrane protein TolC